jgi:hypothetical protein
MSYGSTPNLFQASSRRQKTVPAPLQPTASSSLQVPIIVVSPADRRRASAEKAAMNDELLDDDFCASEERIAAECQRVKDLEKGIFNKSFVASNATLLPIATMEVAAMYLTLQLYPHLPRPGPLSQPDHPLLTSTMVMFFSNLPEIRMPNQPGHKALGNSKIQARKIRAVGELQVKANGVLQVNTRVRAKVGGAINVATQTIVRMAQLVLKTAISTTSQAMRVAGRPL